MANKKNSSETKDAVEKSEKKTSTNKSKKSSQDTAKDSLETITIVSNGHLVSVEYTGTLDSGEEFDSSKNHGPLKFIVGGGQVIRGFDDAVLGMGLNEEKKIHITKENAYGDVNPEMVRKFPLSMIPPEVKSQLKEGGFLVLQAPTGQQIPSKVIAIDDESVTLDINHPLAGKDLHFTLKIVDISEPSENDACGCGCEDCDSECGEDCDCDDGCDCADDCESDADGCDDEDCGAHCDCGHKH